MQFAVSCYDKPNSLELRMKTREAHLEFARSGIIKLIIAAPMLDQNEAMCGSHLILEADSRAALDAALAQDPYAIAGLFEKTVVQTIRIGIHNPS